MTVYQWMFHTPYFIGLIAIGSAALAIDAIWENHDRRRAKQIRRSRAHHPARRVDTRKSKP
jgi:hypothetical protein